MGVPDHDRVRDYVVAQLTALGLRSQVQSTTGIGTSGRIVRAFGSLATSCM